MTPSAEERIALIRELLDQLYQDLENWSRFDVGCTAAYLVYAIVDPLPGHIVELLPDDVYDLKFLDWLHGRFDAEHPIWTYVRTGKDC